MSKRFLGFDDHGEVHDLGHVVHRRIRGDYKNQVAKLYRAYDDCSLGTKGIVETVLRADGDLEHRKLVISYPYEWPANMYKDAVLFHLHLFGELDKVQLTLKDALPNNILFDHTKPVFVDFLSLVPTDQLQQESWLNAGAFADSRFAVVNRMLLPYLVLPFLFMARGSYRTARDLLSTRSCNCDGRPPLWSELIVPPLRRNPRLLLNHVKALALAARLLPLRYFSRSKGADDFLGTIRTLGDAVRSIDATPPTSGYSSYYDEKKEELSLNDIGGFLPKQKVVYEILNSEKPDTVLDIGANTGWYSNLAAKAGASVIALEQDESCADILYIKARRLGLRVLPLTVSYSDLSKKIFGSEDLQADYADRDLQNNPLYQAGVDRFQSDMVLMLGLVHHLVLGEGHALEDVFEVLAKLVNRILVLEFIAMDDEKIVNEPSFFPNLRRSNASTYNLERVMEIGRWHFGSVAVLDSHPETRKILVFRK